MKERTVADWALKYVKNKGVAHSRRVKRVNACSERELDALIAEKLMGWTWLRHTVKVQTHDKREWRTEWRRSLFFPGHGVQPHEQAYGMENVPAVGNEEIATMNAPCYSTDIAAAWLVVEKLRSTRNAAFVLGANGHASQFSAWFNDGIWALAKQQNSCPDVEPAKCLGFATSDTAPRAICLAALKASEVHS